MIPNLKNGSYKGMFNFYLEPNAITTASKKGDSAHSDRPDSLWNACKSSSSKRTFQVDFDTLMADLDAAYRKRISKLACKIRFHDCSQHEKQSVGEYLAELRHAAVDCEFGTQLHSRFKEQFVVGLKANIIKRFLEDKDKDSRRSSRRHETSLLIEKHH